MPSGLSGPKTLSFQELITLASVDPPPAPLEKKLHHLLSTPFISNEATERGAMPKRPKEQGAGPVLRVAEWNINRGENERDVELALAHPNEYLAAARKNSSLQAKEIRRVTDELHELDGADIVILDEVDDGVKRTNYRDVTRDLAKALNMNYAYGVEFIELNRIYLGVEKMDTTDLNRNRDGEIFDLDPKRYLGLEGSAILSRYPIRAARVVRLPELYDWYHGEIQAISDLEKARRWTAEKLFEERIARQVRRGGRMALMVDLEVPQSPTGIMTVVCPHLEDYTGPKGRREQMDTVLSQLPTVSNPVILAGDLNTMGHSSRPVTIRREILKRVTSYRFWIRQIVFWVTPVPGLGIACRAANYFKNYHDPTAFSVPIVLRNKARGLFQDVRNFHFEDGGRFQFEGDRKVSYGHRGSTLANSNQRAWKGFTPTFSFNRTYGGLVGEYKLDWFFVKMPVKNDISGTIEEARFAPHFGRSLQLVNTSLGKRISDHCPITVSLPLGGLSKLATKNRPAHGPAF